MLSWLLFPSCALSLTLSPSLSCTHTHTHPDQKSTTSTQREKIYKRAHTPTTVLLFPIIHCLSISFQQIYKQMAAHCNNSNSSSQFPSVCCVHNTESQPLLGHHSGHHASGSSQYQHQTPPPAYYVDMTGNNKGGHCTSSHAPVHQHCK